MTSISKYDINLVLQDYNLTPLDIYRNDSYGLIIDFEKDDTSYFNEDLVIAELEIQFSEISNIMVDNEEDRIIIDISEDFKLDD